MTKIKVLVVDDSALIRDILQKRLSAHPQIEVVATASDPYVARAKIESMPVDVVTLDLEMPRMDGLTFLRHLMRDFPLPVIVVSSLAGDKVSALACLAQGAVDLVAKPHAGRTVDEMIEDLADKIVSSAGAQPKRLRVAPAPVFQRMPPQSLIVVGASTGGTQAFETLFKSFPSSFPPVVAVIHMPPGFTKTFAQRLDSLMPMTVKEAEDGEPLTAGTIYIAPGNRHVLIQKPRRTIELSGGPPVYNQRPAVDRLFQSAASLGGSLLYGVLLTGMGKDGAEGLKAIRDAGGHTVAQDEATSVVFGMPKEAIQRGAAEAVLPLHEIAQWLSRGLSGATEDS